MIEYKWLKIESKSDYDKIIDLLPEKFKENPYIKVWVEELKLNIGNKCTQICIEYPYYDPEYLSSYYLYYVKKFQDIGKKSVRMHFFWQHSYRGYVTISPIKHYINIGKSYLSPNLILPKKAFLMLSTFQVNAYGHRLDVECFPWMRQQRDFSACAHVAVWVIVKFYGNEHMGYKDIRIGEIVDGVPETENRKLPSHGLSVYQMADIFKQYGFTPLLVQKEEENKEAFYEELISYIESGIPVVTALDSKKHTIAIVGHGEVNLQKLNKCDGIISNSTLINSLIVNDDNLFPYMEVNRRRKGEKYGIDDIDFILVPLYNRVHLEYPVLYQRVMTYLETGNLKIDKNSVIRIYLASSNSVKKSAAEDDEMNLILQDIVIRLEMPKLVWCIEISNYEQYKNGNVSAKIIVDSTASAGDETPWLLIHDSEKLRYCSDDEWYEIEEKISEYNMYTGNLKETG